MALNNKSNLTETNKLELKELLSSLDNEINNLKSLKKYVLQINKSYIEINNDSFNKLLVKKIGKKLINKFPSFKDTFKNISLDIKRQANLLFKTSTNEFRTYCKNEKLKLIDNSPSFIIENLLKVQFNEKNHTVKIGNTYLKKIDNKKIIKTIQIENDRIWKRDFDYRLFYENLFKFYSEILKEKPNPLGWIRLEDLYQTIKNDILKKENTKKRSSLIPYYKDEFSADLSKLWEFQRKKPIDNFTSEFSAIRNSKYLYKIVLPNGQINKYGFIKIKKG